MASNLVAMASNHKAMTSNVIAVAYNLIAMAIAIAFNLIAATTNLKAMASNLIAMASTFPLFRKILAPQLVAGVTRNVSGCMLQHNVLDVKASNEGGAKLEEELFESLESGCISSDTNAVGPESRDFRGGPCIA